MSRKIIGFLIIFFGALFLAGFVYFVFIGNFSFDGILDKFKKNDKVLQVQVTAKTPVVVAQPENNESDFTKKESVRIIATKPTKAEIENNEEIKKIDPQKFTKDDLTRMASSFAERFGSFSNHSNFSNIKDLKIYMSDRMKVWADEYILDKRESIGSADLYYGITTKAVAEFVRDLDEDTGEAVIVVNTRRREATSSTSNTSKVFNQDIVIIFTKEKGAWKVDDANWQDKN